MTTHRGYGFDTIASNNTFNYCSNVQYLIDDIKSLAKDGDFYKSYVMDGLSDKAGGHSYVVDVVYCDGKFYATIFDSVKTIYPAFIGEIGKTFEKVMINANQFQHTWIGCRGFALDTYNILVEEAKNVKNKDKKNYYRDIVFNHFSDIKIEKNNYKKEFFDYIIDKKTKIFSLETDLKVLENKIEDNDFSNKQIKEGIALMQKNIITKEKELNKCDKNDIETKNTEILNIKKELKDNKQKIEDNIAEIKKMKNEIPSITKEITTKEKELEKYVKDEIKKPDFDITKFITNRKGDVKKFTPQQIIDCKWYDSKNITSFDVYHPQMTHLMNDYKTLRKHILYYHNNANNCDEALKAILELEEILPTLNTPEKLQEYKKSLECKKQKMGNNDPKYICSMHIIQAIEKEIDSAIKGEPFKLEECKNYLENNQTYIKNEHEYYKDAVVTIRKEIERGIKYNCFKVEDSNIGKDPKTGQKFESKADEIIAQIIKNPKSEYCFKGYTRRELSHLWVGKIANFLTGYNPESHKICSFVSKIEEKKEESGQIIG